MRTNSVIGCVFLFFVVGCGVTLKTTKVSPSAAALKDGKSAPTEIKGEGIVYALPRTEFEVVQPVKMKFSTSGALLEVYDACRYACGKDEVSVPDACRFNTEPKITFAPPELKTVSLPDYDHLYQVTPSADLFQSLNFKFEIASNGVLDKADVKSTNSAYELVSNIASTLIKAAGTPTIRSALSSSVKTHEGKRSCYAVSVEVGTLAKQNEGELTCKVAREISECLAPFETAVGAEQDALHRLFDKAQDGKLKADVVAAIAANRRERLATAKERRNVFAAQFALEEGRVVEALYQVVIPMGGPKEYESHEETLTLGPTIANGTAQIVNVSDNAASFLARLKQDLEYSPRQYKVKSELPPTFELVKAAESQVVGDGYRYRVPVSAPTSLAVYKGQEGTPQYEYGPHKSNKVIAQYGPIAALPSTFKGKGGHILVKHWPDSGGIHTVEIGAEPIPTTALTSVIDAAATQYQARKDKAAADAKAAAAADPELDALTRQQKILALQKQIKDLEAELAKKE